MQGSKLTDEAALAPLLRQAFRPLFLLGALFSAGAMLLWGLALAGWISLNPYQNVLFWHQHEMIFGFVAAIIVGFLLTAVQNWAGTRATHGRELLVLVLVWLTGRGLMLFGAGLPPALVAAVDLAFLPLAAWFFGSIVLAAGNTRNLFFVPLLLLLMVCNGLMHAGAILNRFELVQYGNLNAIWLVTLVMAIVSGRVLPMFTANGTGTPKVEPLPWLERVALGCLWLIFALHFLALAPRMPSSALALLFAVAALSQLARILRLRFWVTLRVPLLWSLHAAALFIPFGLALFAARHAGLPVTQSNAVHALTAGAMGGMILSMMARVSLGHTGRALQPHPLMTLAFVLVICAALLRLAAPSLLPGSLTTWYLLAIAAWVLAYLAYSLLYLPLLTRPRPDGQPG
ncbi:NnrS family protein [Haliea sp. E1-2-M8]|uniref:NnrS family protein n=1 Tax=Haliea sp. E1-2-M8 TaxID=3064706 RepID=UPI0027240C1D|nr:NnrS family protein [Haliea sp. E1-2-M8]MDO8860371.1 NnrS family protein [Haliea sp. E1-2-M8]